MRKLLAGVAALVVAVGWGADDAPSQTVAGASAVDLRHKVIYQVYLRTCTADGTIQEAEKLIPFWKDLGIDILYLSAFQEADNSLESLSPSHLRAGYSRINPKNPYRIIDYFKVDPEYGTNADLKKFIATAHANGLKVLIDLVYLHCGPNAVFLKDHPEFVQRNPDGTIKIGEEWPFARFDYTNRAVRDYLESNMLFYIREMDADGFRCDVGDRVPLDFWEEGFAKCRAVKPGLIMLNEGSAPQSLKKAFDLGFHWKTFSTFHWIFSASNLCVRTDVSVSKKSVDARALRAEFDRRRASVGVDSWRLAVGLDNHDTVSEFGAKRIERSLGADAMDAVLVLIFTSEGIPFIYNGNEIACENLHCAHWNRFCPDNHAVRWQNLATEKGRARLALVKALIGVRHSNPALAADAPTAWFDHDAPEFVSAFTRGTGEKSVTVAVNCSAAPRYVTFAKPLADGKKPLISRGAKQTGANTLELEPYGYFVK